jgi:hypothetical protein
MKRPTEWVWIVLLSAIAAGTLYAFAMYMERLASRYVAVPVQYVPVCNKPWLSVEDERATCAIEEAARQHAVKHPRPKWDANGWPKKKKA